MLLDELIQFLPSEPGHAGMLVAIGGVMIGAVAWLCGARFSRPVVTLITVALGTMLGLYVPRALGWSFSGAVPAIAAALILGVTGYTLHSMWVGMGLGLTLAFWAAVGCWIKLHHATEWAYPAWPAHGTAIGFAAAIWHGLPTDLTHILPLILGAALICGVAFAILWPTASLLLGWSLAGATLLVIMGLAIVRFGQPKLLDKMVSPLWTQLAVLALLVAVGVLANWLLGPETAPATKGAGKGSGKKSPPKHDQDD